MPNTPNYNFAATLAGQLSTLAQESGDTLWLKLERHNQNKELIENTVAIAKPSGSIIVGTANFERDKSEVKVFTRSGDCGLFVPGKASELYRNIEALSE